MSAVCMLLAVDWLRSLVGNVGDAVGDDELWCEGWEAGGEGC